MATEAVRLETLRGYGILDTPNEPDFDVLVKDIAATFRVGKALISFIDADRQWYKARHGVLADHVPRSISFCTHSIERDAVTVVPDARHDPRFCDSPFVNGTDGVRFYAAAPIKAPNRARIGTVCIFDSTPRTALSSSQTERLAGYAAKVVDLLDERRTRTA